MHECRTSCIKVLPLNVTYGTVEMINGWGKHLEWQKKERRSSIPIESKKNITLSIEEKYGKLGTDASLGSSHSPGAVKEKSNGLLNNLMMLHLPSYKGPFIKAL